jgi:hypothetical protein
LTYTMAMPNWLRFVATALMASGLSAQQQPANRFVHVAVTDPMNRFVTGLTADHLSVRENGVQRPVAFFAGPDDTIEIVVVGTGGSPSVAEALQLLGKSNAVRKGLVVTTDAPLQGVPGNVFVIKVDPAITAKAVIEARNRYVIGFVSADMNATADVVLKQPAGLPPLKAILK